MTKNIDPNYRNNCLDILKSHQTKEGGFLASTLHTPYRSVWFRDSFWCSYALDVLGEHKLAKRGYSWMNDSIVRYENKLKKLEKMNKNDPSFFDSKHHVHAKLNPDGTETTDNWGYRQYDTPSLFLLGISEHVKTTGDARVLNEFKDGIELSIGYISKVWDTPCFDVWEVFGECIHSYNIGVMQAGLREINKFLNRKDLANTTRDLQNYLNANFVRDNKVKKMLIPGGQPFGTDASSIWLFTTFGLIEPSGDTAKNTVEEIERVLGDVAPKRYHLEREYWGQRYDTYYGGGSWLNLACLLGEYNISRNKREKAWDNLLYCYNHRTKEGYLPEQTTDDVFDRGALDYWLKLQSMPATPLAWSHAAYLLLYEKLK